MKFGKFGRIAVVLLSALLLCTSLSSCSLLVDGFVAAINEETSTTAVKGNLDILYHGKIDPDYAELVESSEEELLALYEEGLVVTAEDFCYYWGILSDYETLNDLDSALQQRLIDLVEDISLKTKYEVQPAQSQSNGSYAVQVLISPVDIMFTASDMYDEGGYAPLAQILAEAETLDWENMSEADYWAFANRYGNIIADMFDTLMPDLGYMDEKSIIIQVEEDDDGLLALNEDDMSNFDMQIIPYDFE